MSRSYRKTPIFGISKADSEAVDKRLWHKRLRSQLRDQLATGHEDVFVDEKDVSDPWGMSKDGKRYWKQATAKDMRK